MHYTQTHTHTHIYIYIYSTFVGQDNGQYKMHGTYIKIAKGRFIYIYIYIYILHFLVWIRTIQDAR